MKNKWSKFSKYYNSLSRPAKAALWFMICSILQRSVSLITTPIFTRLLSTEQYGLYSIYNSWEQIFIIFTTLRLDYGVFNKGMSKFKNERDAYTLTMQTLSSFLTILLAAVYFLFYQRINQMTELPTVLMALILGYCFLAPAVNYWMLRQRYEFRYKSVVVYTLSVTVLNTLVGIIAVLVCAEEYKAYARIFSGFLVQLCFWVAIYFTNIKRGQKLFNWKFAKFALLFNLPLIPHYISTYIMDQSDRIMIQKMVGLEAVALYGVIYTFSMILKIVTNSISNALIPWQYDQLEKKNFYAIKKQVNSILLILAILIFAFIAFAPEALLILAGSRYAAAVYIIPPIASSVFFTFMFGIFGNIEFYYDANKFTMFMSMFGAALNIVLNYIFIPLYGYEAAGYTTLVCYLVFCLLHYIFMESLAIKKEGQHIFDSKYILMLSVILLVATTLMAILYNFSFVIRYAIIGFIVIIFIIKRDYFLGVFRMMKRKKN